MIKDLCKKIKDKRKEAGYSIEDIVKETKLHPSVIKDIENCNLGAITPIYIKGFIKIYASFLGIEIKDELEQIKTGVDPKIKNPRQRKQPGQNLIVKFFKIIFKTLAKIPPRVRKNILLIGLSLIILWLGFLGVRFSFRKVLAFFRNRPRAEKQEPAKNPAEEPAEEVKKPAQSVTRPIGQSGQISASLTLKKPCYMKAISDGEVVFEGVLNKGEVETWKADKELKFEIRDGSAVYLEVDGESIPKLSSIHKPIKIIIDSSGITVNK
ncbi:MAG: helix-turn-helix domain-containing protein [Candidatus Omnitrophica bacterium]|nr:helix-turn-helix domain-containing protein [Candidatus Omnitrophota bacterium]MCF7877077.1 helix-turn-helix domain-containing protein [Candidatus Omnitrophota bacterium]MCF7878994.1 helix-turn-helix domain-containing protein [Candidatus Omnitrophota bacterium]MCF7893357.1 helix-turn-helix domain-containing protein [Candidatus Omnitrophota bacterium]